MATTRRTLTVTCKIYRRLPRCGPGFISVMELTLQGLATEVQIEDWLRQNFGWQGWHVVIGSTKPIQETT